MTFNRRGLPVAIIALLPVIITAIPAFSIPAAAQQSATRQLAASSASASSASVSVRASSMVHPALQPMASSVDPAPPSNSQCDWITDCTFSTYQPNAPTGTWYPNKGGDVGVTASGGALSLPYVSGMQENINFGPYDPQSTYAYTLTFDAEVVQTCATCDPDAQLYVGFEPNDCSYNWFRLYADQGWQTLAVTGTYNPNANPPIVTNPSGAINYPGPPQAVCFLNEYGNHATDKVANVSLAIAQNGHLVYRGPIGAEIGPGSNPSEPNICACSRTFTQKPVNSDTGDFFHTFTDISIPGRGIPLQFTRTYNSIFATQDSPIGYGWSENDDAYLTTDSTGTITATQENGTVVVFNPTASGGYEAPGRVLATLTAHADGTFTLTRKDRTTLTFTTPTTSTIGQLLTETDRNNYTTSFTYTNGLLSRVTDSAGRSLRFMYTGTHIKAITDPIGRTVAFTYDASGNLTDAVDVGGGITHFAYYAGTHLLRTMTDPRGGVVTNAYDGMGRVLSQTDPLSHTTTFGYVTNPDLSQTTVITDPDGHVTADRYVNNVLLSETRGYGTPDAATWTYASDPNTLGVTEETDPNRHTSYDTYDSNGNLLSHTDALSRTTSYAYDALNDTTAITDPSGAVTVMTYDANGNLLSTSHAVTTTPGQQPNVVPQNAAASVLAVRRGSVPSRFQHTAAAVIGRSSVTISPTASVAATGTTRAATQTASVASVTPTVSHRAMAALNSSPVGCAPPILPPASPTSGWDTSSISLPVPLGRPAVAVGCDGNVYVFGGSTPTGLNSITYQYNPSANAWSQRQPLPVAREGAQAVTLPDGRIAVLGGAASATGTGCTTNLCTDGTVYQRVDVYDPTTDTWSTLPAMTSPRYRFAAALVNGKIFAIGGSDGTQVVSTTEWLDPSAATPQWTAGILLPQPILSPAVAVDETGAVDLAGGVGADLGTTLATLYTYTGTGWLSGPSLPQATIDAAGTLGRDGRVYIIGGWSSVSQGSLTAVQTYDPVQGQWTSGPSLPAALSEMAAVSLPDGRILILGGQNATADTLSAQGAVYAPPLAGATPTATPSASSSPSPTATPTPSATATDSPTPTSSATPSMTPTATPTASPSPALCPQASPYTATVCLTYDSAHPGDVLTRTDPDGHVTHYTYDANGDLASVRDPLGDLTTYTYDPVGRKLTMVRPDGNIAGANPISYTTTYTENAFGQTTAITDGLGNVTRYQYDADQNLITTTDALQRQTIDGYDLDNERTSVRKPDGGVWLTGYDQAGNVISQTDPLSHTTVYGYDALNRRISVTDPLNRITLYGYDLAGNLITVTDPLSNTTIYGYDNANERTSARKPDGGIWRTGYDLDGRVITTTDGLQNLTQYAYDSLGRRTSVTDPLNRTTLDGYDLAGNLITVTDPLSRTTVYGYDDANRQTSVTRPDQSVIHTGYDADGNVISTTDPLSHTTTYGYDALDRHITTTDALTRTTIYWYNAVGDRTAVTDPNHHTTIYGYDALDRVITTTDPLGHSTLQGYDLAGNLITTTDALKHTTINGYDAANERTSVTQPDHSVLRTGYDLASNVITSTDALGRLTRYGYDPMDQVITMTNPLSETTVYTYDLDGNRTALIDPMQRTTRYGYDADSEPMTITYSDGTTPNVTFNYYKSGQRASMTDGTGTTSYQYDQLDRTYAVTNGAGQTVGYRYDLAGNLTNLIYPDSSVITRTYDAANEWIGVTDPFGHTTRFGYDPAGNLQTEAYPTTAPLVSTLGYNAADQLTSIADREGSATVAAFGYARDKDGQVSAALDSLDGHLHYYGYNALNQLTYDVAANKAGRSALGYAPDSAGEITATVNQAAGYGTLQQYDLGGELTSLQVRGSHPVTYTYGYNLDGDRTDVSIVGTPTGASYGYDEADRLITATVGGTQANYSYDGDGLRQSKTVSATTTQETWDTAEGLPLLVQDGSIKYITGPDGVPLEVISGTTVAYLLHDQLGSVRGILSSVGALIGTATYDPYGNVKAHSGATTPFGFAGQFTDAETGFQYLQARYYDPATAQFLTVDPLESQTKLPYIYGDANPVNAVDPGGLSCNGASGSGVGRVFSAVGDLLCNVGEVKDTLLTGQANGTTTAMVNEATSILTFEPTVAGGPGSGCGDAAAYDAQAERDQQQLDTEATNANILAATIGGVGLARSGIGLIRGARALRATSGASDNLVNLANPERTDHILYGETYPNGNFGGGHIFPGLPGKSAFPPTWSADRIMHEVSDVATDPTSQFVQQGNDVLAIGTRNGVKIKVVIRNGEIWTAYPINIAPLP